MANYTTKLRTVCEFLAGYKYEGGYDSLDDVIDRARPILFNFDYPIWDNGYRATLEKKIIRHYFNYEIGQETPALFKFELETKLNEIMPYYNELYKTTVLEFNPLYSVDYTVTLERKYTGKDKQDGTSHNEGATTDTERGTLDRSDKTKRDSEGEALRTDNLKESGTRNATSDTDRNRNLNANGSKDVSKSASGTEKTTTSGSGTENTTTSGDGTERKTGSKNGSSSGNSTERFSDTPQGDLAGMGARSDGMGNISYNMWLTNATLKDKSESFNESYTDTTTKNESGKKDTSTSESGKKDVTTSETVTEGETNSHSETEGETTHKAEDESDSRSNTGTQKHDTTETSTEDYGRTDSTTHNANGTSRNDGQTSKTGSYEKTDDYVRHVLGKDNKTDYGDLINKLRSAIINIDMMIITDLAECFMQIW